MKKTLVLTAVTAMLLTLCSCHTHSAASPLTCTDDEICSECGEIMREAKGHVINAPATCTEDSVCTVCGEILEKAKGHKFTDTPYLCTDGRVCTVCGETVTAPKEHASAGEATCTEPEICSDCGYIINEAKGHIPDKEASCTEASVCMICNETLSAALGHSPGPDATATEPQKCTVCDTVLKPATGSVSPTYIEETVNEGHYLNNIDAYYSGNVLVCGNYGVEYFGASASGNAEYASIVSEFAKKFPQVSVKSMIVPKAATFHSPKGYKDQQSTHKAFIDATYAMMDESVITCDAFGEIALHEGEYMFYRTDHHWTSLGAYYASVAYCKANGITPRALSTYETVINSGFMGSLYTYAKSPKPTSFVTDYTVGHLPAVSYTMTYTTDGKTYNGTAINKNAKSYASMFMCGDQAYTHVVTENKNGKKLIVFKESYGNAFVPYMIDYYEEIVVIDIRKTTAGIANIITEHGITDALIINNIQAVSSLRSSLKAKLES